MVGSFRAEASCRRPAAERDLLAVAPRSCLVAVLRCSGETLPGRKEPVPTDAAVGEGSKGGQQPARSTDLNSLPDLGLEAVSW